MESHQTKKRAARVATATGLLVAFLLVGSSWVVLTEFIPAGLPRDLTLIGVGLLFAGLFLWLLVDAVKALYSVEGFRWIDLGLMAVNLLLMLAAYAYIYNVLGVIDTTRDGSPIIGGSEAQLNWANYGKCFYFSVASLTTVGYGDLQPTAGMCRVVAGSQALLGYIVLGVTASTAADIVQSVAGKKREG
jgi:hypothetical protein